MSKLTSLTADINRLARERRDALRNAYAWDKDRSHEYNQELKREAEDRVRAQFDPQIDALKSEAKDVAANAASAGAKQRPPLDLADPAQAAGVQMEWTNRVLPLLRAGKALRSILEAGDTHTALAAERYAPAWFQANEPTVLDYSFIADNVANRLADLAPNEAASAAIRDAHNATADYAVFNDVAASVDSPSSAAHLDASVKAAYATGEVNLKRGTGSAAGPTLEGAVSAHYGTSDDSAA